MTLKHALLVAIALLLVYLFLLLWRLVKRSGGRASRHPPSRGEAVATGPAHSFDSVLENSLATQARPVTGSLAIPPAGSDLVTEEARSALPVARAHEIALQALQASVRALEKRCQVLEGVVEDLQTKLRADELVRQSSPLYAEAVALARRGYDAEAIAERCGISVAEAQLVSSLSATPEGEGRPHDRS